MIRPTINSNGTDMQTVLGAYFTALGVQAAASAYCIPILTGARPVPSAVDTAVVESSAKIAEGMTVTLVEAAKRKGVSRATVYRMTKDGTLPTVCIRGKNRVRLGDLDRAFTPSTSACK